MSVIQQAVTIAICSFGTMLTRFLPFLAFSSKKPTPRFVVYLGRALPPAIFAMLVVYCLRDTTSVSASVAVSRLISIAIITIVHLWKRNTLISIFSGVASYMLLIRLIAI